MTTAIREAIGAHVTTGTTNLEPLSHNEIKRIAPSVFATGAHESASSKYGFASTSQLLTALEKHGYVPVEVRAYLRRDPARVPYTKHLVRLRRAGVLSKVVKGDVVPQLILVNSHDRSSQLSMYGGMYRCTCDNGLLVSSGAYVEPLHVRHTNRIIEDLMANVDRIAADVAKATNIITDMSKVQLSDRQQLAFARAALDLRNGNGTKRGSVDAASLLVPRRTADAGSDVWHVYNRVQENMIKGGIESVSATGRTTHTRPVTSLEADLSINGGLWELAMAAIDKARGR